MKYITLSRCEDEPHFEIIEKKKLEKQFNDGEYEGYDFLTRYDGDLMEFPSNSILIIKGEIIIPKAKQVVKEYEII